MKSKTIIPLAVGLIVGVFAVSRGLSYIKSVKGAARSVQTVAVVAAAAEIPQGVAITEQMVCVKEVPKSLTPPRVFSDPQEVFERVSSMLIPKDMPVLPTMLSPKGTSPGLGAKIPDGMRAVAVKVDEWSAVGGSIKPGVRVDVAAAFTIRGDRKLRTMSKIILQNIQVAAVGATMGQTPQDTGASISKSVTLIVKPQDVSKLHLAATKGKIQLAMRGSLDDTNERVVAQDQDELLGEGKKRDGTKALAGLFQHLFSSERPPEPVQLAQVPRQYMVDLINGSRYERRAYRGMNSMEQVGSEGTTTALLHDEARPYDRQARRGMERASERPFGWTEATEASFSAAGE